MQMIEGPTDGMAVRCHGGKAIDLGKELAIASRFNDGVHRVEGSNRRHVLFGGTGQRVDQFVVVGGTDLHAKQVVLFRPDDARRGSWGGRTGGDMGRRCHRTQTSCASRSSELKVILGV